jgi:hypothetical protein
MSQTIDVRPFHEAEEFAFLEPIHQAAPLIRQEALRVSKGFRAVTWIRRSSFSRHHGFCEGFRARFLLHYAGIEFGLNQPMVERFGLFFD